MTLEAMALGVAVAALIIAIWSSSQAKALALREMERADRAEEAADRAESSAADAEAWAVYLRERAERSPGVVETEVRPSGPEG